MTKMHNKQELPVCRSPGFPGLDPYASHTHASQKHGARQFPRLLNPLPVSVARWQNIGEQTLTLRQKKIIERNKRGSDLQPFWIE